LESPAARVDGFFTEDPAGHPYLFPHLAAPTKASHPDSANDGYGLHEGWLPGKAATTSGGPPSGNMVNAGCRSGSPMTITGHKTRRVLRRREPP